MISKLPTRPLGSSGLEITPVGFGAWAIGGLVWNEQNRMGEPSRVLKPESIRREVEASLRRLGMERIDLYQFHWPDDTGTPVEVSWETMSRLVEEGKIRAAGVSGAGPGRPAGVHLAAAS